MVSMANMEELSLSGNGGAAWEIVEAERIKVRRVVGERVKRIVVDLTGDDVADSGDDRD